METPSRATHIRFVVQLPEVTVIIYALRVPFFEKVISLPTYNLAQLPSPPTYNTGPTLIEVFEPPSPT